MSIPPANRAPYRVVILVLPESSMMCVASVVEPFRAANRVAGNLLYDWTLASLNGEQVEMTCHLPVSVHQKFSDGMRGDLLIVVGGFNQKIHVDTAAVSSIRKAASGFGAVAGVEAGSWVVARAGLLNGCDATTHWEDFEAFAGAFPEVELKLDRYVVDNNRMTCGGASPAFDMFLDLIRKRDGPAIAMEVASVFVYDEAHSHFEEQPLVSLGRVAKREPRMETAVRLMENHIEQPLPTAAIARRLRISPGTLEALFKRHVGMPPGRFYLNIRLKAANRLVQNSDLSLQEVAVRSGFNSLSAFSRAYRRGFGIPAREARMKR